MNINNNKYQQVSFKYNFLFHSTIGILIHVIYKSCVSRPEFRNNWCWPSGRGRVVHKWRRKRRPWPWLSSSASLACAHSNLGCPDPLANFKTQINFFWKIQIQKCWKFKIKNKNTLFNTTLTEQLSQFGLCTFQLGLRPANFKIQIQKCWKVQIKHVEKIQKYEHIIQHNIDWAA